MLGLQPRSDSDSSEGQVAGSGSPRRRPALQRQQELVVSAVRLRVPAALGTLDMAGSAALVSAAGLATPRAGSTALVICKLLGLKYVITGNNGNNG